MKKTDGKEDGVDKNLRRLNALNPDIGIRNIADNEFQSYGRVLRSHNTDALFPLLSGLVPGDDIVYVSDLGKIKGSSKTLAALVRHVFNGSTELQVGAVYGRNTKLNALEYHKCAEVIVAELPLIFMTGLVCEIEWPKGTYDLSKVRAFYVPGGTAFEVHPWCLHYVPIHVYGEDGFKCLVILPKGTNMSIDYEPVREGEGKLLLSRNKWLLAHPDDSSFAGTAVHFGLMGRNIELKTL